MAVDTAFAEAFPSALHPQTGELPAEPDTFVDGLEDIINDFRLPAGTFYSQLEGSERATLPSIESQVAHLQNHIQYWLSDAIEIASDSDFCAEDPVYTSTQGQVNDLCLRSLITQSNYSNWEHDYMRSEQNVAGQFVAWATRRAVRPVIKQAVAAFSGEPTIPTPADTDHPFTHLPGTLKHIAKDKKVRRTAYQARMDAKIGLACLRAIPPHTIPQLGEYFQLGNQEQSEVPDLMEVLARKQALLDLGFAWLQPLTELEPLPF